MEYILFIHNNVQVPTTKAQWDVFFKAAHESEVFLGGSEIAEQMHIGKMPASKITEKIAGFMRFESEDKTHILQLLKKHPVVVQGGTVELCEMPKSAE